LFVIYRFFGGSKDGSEQDISSRLRRGEKWFVPFGEALSALKQNIYEFREPNELHFIGYVRSDQELESKPSSP
jgi:hypothetical protein